MRVKEIDWETDGVEVELPTAVTVPSDLEEDEIADYLSDQYGWLVNGFVMEAESFGAEMKLPKLTKTQMDFLKYKTSWFMAYSAYARGKSDRYWSPQDWKDGKAEQCFTVTGDGWGNENIARRTLKSLLEKKVLYTIKTDNGGFGDGRVRKSPAQQVNENPDLIFMQIPPSYTSRKKYFVNEICLGLTPIGVEIIKREFARQVKDVVAWRIELTLEDGQTAYLSDMPDDVAQSIDDHIEDVKWDIRGEQFGAEEGKFYQLEIKYNMADGWEWVADFTNEQDAIDAYYDHYDKHPEVQIVEVDSDGDGEWLLKTRNYALGAESNVEELKILELADLTDNDIDPHLQIIAEYEGKLYSGILDRGANKDDFMGGFGAESFGAELESGEAALRIVVSEGQLSVYHDASNHLLMRRPIYAGEWDKIMASLNAAESFGAEKGRTMVDDDGRCVRCGSNAGFDYEGGCFTCLDVSSQKLPLNAESFGAEFAGYEDPISERQRYRIRKLGGRIDKAMTRSDASKYIKSLMAMPLHAETTDCSACQGWGWNEELDMVCDADGCIGGWVVPKKPSLLERGLELGAGMGMGMAGVAILFGLVGGTVGFAAETRKKRRD